MPANTIRVISSQQPVNVVVRFKGTTTARRSLNALAARDLAVAGTGRDGPLERLLQQAQVESMRPLFADRQPQRGLRTTRLAMSVGEEGDELSGLNVLRISTGPAASDAIKRLKTDPRVEYAHVIEERFLYGMKKKPRRRKRTRAAANDPMLTRQWGLNAVRLAQAQASAGFREATQITIAVIDSGIDSNHPDLQGVFQVEENFTSGPKKDTQGHGTHVSGIIASVRNNALGISGLCQSKRLMSLKALGPYDGPGYYRAIRYATDRGAQIINLSLGGSHDPTEELLIKRALDRNVVVVAAMGNEFDEGNPTSYPAAIPGVIAVGAVDELDRHADFSNTGSHIALVAPGVNILSTVPTYPCEMAAARDYEAWPGTSMATPFVAAAAALLLAKNPALKVPQIKKALQDGADRVPGQAGVNKTYGHGRLNVAKSLALV